MTNSLTVVAKVYSNTRILLLKKKCNLAKQKPLTFFFLSAKNINAFAIFQDRTFNVMLANNFV